MFIFCFVLLLITQSGMVCCFCKHFKGWGCKFEMDMMYFGNGFGVVECHEVTKSHKECQKYLANVLQFL